MKSVHSYFDRHAQLNIVTKSCPWEVEDVRDLVCALPGMMKHQWCEPSAPTSAAVTFNYHQNALRLNSML